jgi:NADPH-dependent 2,4-dienoyl-CoA reductase/sulfur reductase-like enzyme
LAVQACLPAAVGEAGNLCVLGFLGGRTRRRLHLGRPVSEAVRRSSACSFPKAGRNQGAENAEILSRQADAVHLEYPKMQPSVAILGGGVAALSAAHELAEHL